MRKQVPGSRFQVPGGKFRHFALSNSLKPETHTLCRGFTLVETMVAIALISVAIVAPLALTTKSFAGSHYARDQITAYHLAQEAIETVRHVRDGNVLKIARGDLSVNILGPIPIGEDFIVDTTNDSMPRCSTLQQSGCPALKRNSAGIYNHASVVANNPSTQFTRVAHADFVDAVTQNEINVSITVSWQTGNYPGSSFTISENLTRWVEDSSAAR